MPHPPPPPRAVRANDGSSHAPPPAAPGPALAGPPSPPTPRDEGCAGVVGGDAPAATAKDDGATSDRRDGGVADADWGESDAGARRPDEGSGATAAIGGDEVAGDVLLVAGDDGAEQSGERPGEQPFRGGTDDGETKEKAERTSALHLEKRRGEQRKAPSAKKVKMDEPSAPPQLAAIQQQQQPQQSGGPSFDPLALDMFQAQAIQAQAMQAQRMLQAQQVANAQQMQAVANAQQMQVMAQAQQMMNWAQPLGAQLNPMQNLMPTVHPAMMMMGAASSAPNVVHKDLRWITLTLPSPSRKLGLLLEDNYNMGMPELTKVDKDSPVRSQIPFVKGGYCIAAMKSEAIGSVQPTTAEQCAKLIQQAQSGPTKPVQLEIGFVEMQKKSSVRKGESNLPKSKKGRKPANETGEHKRLQRNLLLDFFSDPGDLSIYAFLKERGHDSLRSSIARIIKTDERLASLVGRRDVAACRKEAYDIIEKKFPDATEEDEKKARRAKKEALIGFFSQAKCDFATFCQDNKLSGHLRRSLEKLIQGDEVLSYSVNVRRDAKKRKKALHYIENRLFYESSVEAASERAKSEQELKVALLDFFSNSSGISLELFCQENKFDDRMRRNMRRFIDRDSRLERLVDMRNVSERRERAINLIEEHLGHVLTKDSHRNNFGIKTNGNASSQDANAIAAVDATMNGDVDPLAVGDEFFTPGTITYIASNLDLDARPRMSRDGSKEITIHDRRSADELLTLLILDLNHRVVRGRALSHKDKNAVLASCAKILFYDHGFKKVIGTSNLEKTWESRLEKAYMTGADTNPLKSQYQGSHSYTTKVEREHPGYLLRLYEYTEKTLGSDASSAEKAMFMNEKSMEDAYDDPTVPILRLNKTNLYFWERHQKHGSQVDGDADTSAQNSSEGEQLSINQIDRRHPGLIDEFYNFAIEALGPDASFHMLAICMNERSKEISEENPAIPVVTMSKVTLPNWVKKRGFM